ncbi:MAG: alginate export family protein, partial [Planctomycetota bacterium]
MKLLNIYHIAAAWLLGVTFVAAQTQTAIPSTQPSNVQYYQGSTKEAKTLLIGPKYAPLRYDDDFSYLDGPEDSYKPDIFDPIKRIHLTEDLTLRLGGEIRGRLEAVTHKRYGAEVPTQDTFFLHRYYYHADFKYRKLARLFIEGISAWVEDRDATPIPVPEDRFDIHQMFIDLRFLGQDVPLTLRFGRQELQYGKQRLISPLDWANVRRTWDGVKVFWQDENWNIDTWYVRP